VDALRAVPAGESLALEELGERVKPGFTGEEAAWLRELVEALARDGLVETAGDAGGLRVALPR
jgi:hypothetical protein